MAVMRLPNLLIFQDRKMLKWQNFQTAGVMASVISEGFDFTFQCIS